MRLTFQLRFHTHPGQSLLLSGNHEIFGNEDPAKALPLSYLNNEFWQVLLVLPSGTAPNANISYHYILREPDGTLTDDWGRGRFINPASLMGEETLILDSWNAPGFYENAFFTEPFSHVLLKQNRTVVPRVAPGHATHTFHVKAPLLTRSQTLCLLGSSSSLGGWNTEQATLLSKSEGEDDFSVELDLRETVFPVEYKYGVYDMEQRRFVRYEDGQNRTLLDSVSPHRHVIVNDGFAVLPSTTWKGAGVAIPVFSLRSEKSFGIGEFADLKPLADWCRQTGLKLIQILPVNDTIATHTWKDSYPYSAISAFALHPIYLRLGEMVNRTNQPLLDALEQKRKQLNASPVLDYEAVVTAKLDFIKQIYPSQKEATFKSPDFQGFLRNNRDWLEPYACFAFLRDKYRTPDFNQWPTHRLFKQEEIAKLAAPESPDYSEIAFHYFVQYHLHSQLKNATEYAHAQGVVLKGDIAIGVHRNGSDAWQGPDLFHLDMQAGAPPDAFGIKGQNWSFPTYNWPRMQQDGFSWWKRRFEQMGRYFDAFRIDHILGFFRIWSVPLHAVEGILGYFVPALPVESDEMERRAIRFDLKRFVEPWITEEVLDAVFGSNKQVAKKRFVVSDGAVHYHLKPEFATQRQIEDFFATPDSAGYPAKMKEGLFDLISNVILLQPGESSKGQFHFRFSMETTWSFKALDGQTQDRLRDLYLDYFYWRQEDFWRKEGLKKLPALKRATNMLVCGEDLGMVPNCVPQVMKHLGLLGLEVQRMPKSLNQEFFRPKDAPYLSVITPSTHDMSTIRGWWEEDREVIQRFYNNELGMPGTAPATCEGWINKLVVQQHLVSPAMWSIFQLQDLLGLDETLRRPNAEEERINVPANPRNYWRYRMHFTLEQLGQATRFNEELKSMLTQAGR